MRYIGIAVLAGLLAAAVTGCGSSKGTASGNRYGKAIPADMAVIDAKTILDSPQDFDSKDVLVKGKITSECPSGCWVWLKDASGEVYVDLAPAGIAIPQKVGSTVKAMGTVVLEQGRPRIAGSGLEF